jgi:phosphatidylglycerophosphate synthase
MMPAPAPAPAPVAGAVAAPPEPIRATLQRLSTAQKGAAGAPAYSRFVNRPAGRLLAAVAYRLGLTPNAVTGISAVCTFTGIGLFAALRSSPALGGAVAALLALGYALDSADGQLARLRGSGSPAGEWLDHVVDAAKAVTVHLAVLVALYRFAPLGHGAVLLVPLGYAVVDVVHLFATLLNEQLRRNHGRPERAHATGTRPSTLRALVVLPTDYGVLALSFALLGVPAVFFGVYCALFAGTAGYLALACVRWFHEMAGLAPAPSGRGQA